MAHLIVRYSNGNRCRHDLSKPEVVIGRDASCDLSLEDAITSRFHAKVSQRADKSIWIQDLNSKNGITVNEQNVAGVALNHGDRIGIGNCVITLLTEDQPVVVLQDAATDTLVGATSAWKADPHAELSQRRLKSLYELNERLAGRFDRDDLLRELLSVCIEQLRFERAGIALWEARTKHLQWIKLINVGSDQYGEFRISRSVVDRATHLAERILINDTGSGDVDPTQSMISNNIRSAMCVPMDYLQEVHGVIYGDRITSSGGYTKEDIDFFGALGRLGALGLANVQLVEEIKSRQQVEAQLRTAREIQANLFPPGPLRLEGVRIDALNDPGQRVSGDYYDYFVREDGLIGVIIADVAGKGLPAALLMANLQSAVRLIMDSETDVTKLTRQLNKFICHNIGDSRFITGIFGLLDAKARQLVYCNAGHLPPYVIERRQSVRRIEIEPALPLGIDANFEYKAAILDLPASPSMLVAFTDGVTEAEDEQGVQFTESRVGPTLEANLKQPSDELVTRIRRSIKQFTRSHPQNDDITLVAIELT
ncbi:MAG: SpoIIE family protein phosphatase [Planctomycetes bacterium]|nr:SpoIIE family protein phosphatase [Planctomycetota bacterium]